MKGTTRKRGTTWTYQFSVTRGGQRRHITKGGFARQRDAAAAMREAMVAYRRGEHVEPSRVTVADYLRDWIDGRHDLKPSTVRGYRDIIEGRLIPHLGDVRLGELTGGDIGRAYTALRTTGGRTGDGLSERSLKHTHTVLGKALEDATRRRLIGRNPVRDVDPPRPRNAEMKVWTVDEVRAFLASTAGDRLQAAYALVLSTGLRRGELLGLRWADVNLDTGQLAVRRSRVAAGYQVHEGEPKAGRARTIALDDDTMALLRRHRRAQLEERMAWGEVWVDSGHVFTRENGEPLHPQTLAWHFERSVRDARVPAIRFHDLRHTHAVLLLIQGVHPKIVQERLGHSSIAITWDIYGHVIPGMQEEAAAKVGALIYG